MQQLPPQLLSTLFIIVLVVVVAVVSLQIVVAFIAVFDVRRLACVQRGEWCWAVAPGSGEWRRAVRFHGFQGCLIIGRWDCNGCRSDTLSLGLGTVWRADNNISFVVPRASGRLALLGPSGPRAVWRYRITAKQLLRSPIRRRPAQGAGDEPARPVRLGTRVRRGTTLFRDAMSLNQRASSR